MPKNSALSGLYAISEQGWHERPVCEVEQLVREAFLGGVKIFQLRQKSVSDEELLPLARFLRRLCHEFGMLFIINDRLKLAQEVRADGVHLGREDTGIAHARKLLPSAIIGISCYGDIKRAREMEEQGADYVAFGACFASSSKPSAQVIGTGIFREKLSIPRCGIGGISAENAHLLRSSEMIAVISALWSGGAKEVQARARAILYAWRGESEN
ncbi:MAG: thiamine phosphate synthase [Wolinella sp.]